YEVDEPQPPIRVTQFFKSVQASIVAEVYRTIEHTDRRSWDEARGIQRGSGCKRADKRSARRTSGTRTGSSTSSWRCSSSGETWPRAQDKSERVDAPSGAARLRGGGAARRAA